MAMQGKIVRGKAIDLPMYNKAGWQIIPHKAFKNIAPDVLAEL